MKKPKVKKKKKQKSERVGFYPHEFESLSEVISGIEADFKGIDDYIKRDYELIDELSENHSEFFYKCWTSCLYVINELLSRIEFEESKENRLYNQMYLWQSLCIEKDRIAKKTNFKLMELTSKILEYMDDDISEYCNKHGEIIEKEIYFSAQSSCNVMCICNHIRHRVKELCCRCMVESSNQIIMNL